MGIPQETVSYLQAAFPYLVLGEELPYLRIIFPLSKFQSTNYKTLLKIIQTDISTYSKTFISWLGCIATIKILLPKILYYFRLGHSIPLFPPK